MTSAKQTQSPDEIWTKFVVDFAGAVLTDPEASTPVFVKDVKSIAEVYSAIRAGRQLPMVYLWYDKENSNNLRVSVNGDLLKPIVAGHCKNVDRNLSEKRLPKIFDKEAEEAFFRDTQMIIGKIVGSSVMSQWKMTKSPPHIAYSEENRENLLTP